MSATPHSYRFKISLQGITPEIWRRILVPADYTFWDLHVAIQDSMGWLDYHLHAFRVTNPKSGEIDQIGIPDDDAFEGDVPFLPGWTIPLSNYFLQPGDRAQYEYDFGDGREHEVILEAVAPRVPRRTLPRCLDGKRACPPEDCGGVPGYDELLKVLRDPSHAEYDNMAQWLGRVYNPETFNPKTVRFESPKKRFRAAFEGNVP